MGKPKEKERLYYDAISKIYKYRLSSQACAHTPHNLHTHKPDQNPTEQAPRGRCRVVITGLRTRAVYFLLTRRTLNFVLLLLCFSLYTWRYIRAFVWVHKPRASRSYTNSWFNHNYALSELHVSEICHRRRHRRTRIKNQSDEINKLTMSNEYNKVLSPTPATALYSIVNCGKHPRATNRTGPNAHSLCNIHSKSTTSARERIAEGTRNRHTVRSHYKA